MSPLPESSLATECSKENPTHLISLRRDETVKYQIVVYPVHSGILIPHVWLWQFQFSYILNVGMILIHLPS